MLDHDVMVRAFRARARDLVVATTGTTTLSATSAGYSRASGSFITDGFRLGMEVTPSGFVANTDAGIITALTATLMTIGGGCTVEAGGGDESLTVGLPELQAWEMLDFSPVGGRPYISESLVPATSEQVTMPYDGGQSEETGLYVLRWYGLSGKGQEATRKCVDALRALFTSGTTFTVGSDTVRVRGDVGPQVGQILAVDGGWGVLTLTVPWEGRSANTVAA